MQLASPPCIKVQQCDAMLTGNNMGCNTGGLNRFQTRSERLPWFFQVGYLGIFRFLSLKVKSLLRRRYTLFSGHLKCQNEFYFEVFPIKNKCLFSLQKYIIF